MTVELPSLRFSVEDFTFYMQLLLFTICARTFYHSPRPPSPYLNTSGLDKPLIRGVKKSACAISFSLQ